MGSRSSSDTNNEFFVQKYGIALSSTCLSAFGAMFLTVFLIYGLMGEGISSRWSRFENFLIETSRMNLMSKSTDNTNFYKLISF